MQMTLPYFWGGRPPFHGPHSGGRGAWLLSWFTSGMTEELHHQDWDTSPFLSPRRKDKV